MKSNLQINIGMIALILIIMFVGGLIVAASSLINSALAQGTNNEGSELVLKGTVKGDFETETEVLSEHPLNSAQVILMDENYEQIAMTETTEDGEYELVLGPEQKYHILAVREGYITRRFTIETAASFESKEEIMDIHVEKASQFSVHNNKLINKVVANNGEYPKKDKEYIEWVVFKVQVGNYTKPVPAEYFSKIGEVESIKSDNSVTYTAGNFKNFEEAKKHLKEIKKKGYSDAFITAYDLSENKIPTQKAIAAMAGKQ